MNICPCLLHHDYHELGPECTAVAILWAMGHRNVPYERRWELYELEVEGRILEDTWKLGPAWQLTHTTR